MAIRTLLFLLVLSIPTFAQVVTERHDKFKDITTFSYSGGYLNSKGIANVKFYAYYVKETKGYWLRFIRTGQRLVFDDRRSLIFLIDGQHTDFAAPVYDIDNESRSLKETLTFLATRQVLEDIANGRNVQFQLGTLEAELSEKQKKGVKELLESAK